MTYAWFIQSKFGTQFRYGTWKLLQAVMYLNDQGFSRLPWEIKCVLVFVLNVEWLMGSSYPSSGNSLFFFLSFFLVDFGVEAPWRCLHTCGIHSSDPSDSVVLCVTNYNRTFHEREIPVYKVLKLRTFTYNKNHTFISLTRVVFLFWPENTYFFAWV